MKTSFILQTEQLRKRIIHVIEHLALQDPVHEIVIRPFHYDRSAEQNKLYWKWIGIIAPELGYTKPEMHDEFRLEFLVPIFQTREDGEYREKLEALYALVEQAYPGSTVHSNPLLRNAVLNITSTTDAKVKEMSDYMREVERRAAEFDIYLPHPDDRGRIEPHK